MSELKTLSNGQVVTLLDGDELGDAGDVLMRVGADGAAYRPVSDVAAAWGGITGTLSAQTDLQSALDAKAAASTAILHQATALLTDAQIKVLPTAGPEIVAAPGANKLIVFQSAVVIGNVQAGAYTNIDDGTSSLVFAVSNEVSSRISDEGPGSSLSNLLTDTSQIGRVQFVPLAKTIDAVSLLYTDSPKDLSNETNQPLLFYANNSGNFTGGNAANTLRVSVTYYILNTLTGVFE